MQGRSHLPHWKRLPDRRRRHRRLLQRRLALCNKPGVTLGRSTPFRIPVGMAGCRSSTTAGARAASARPCRRGRALDGRRSGRSGARQSLLGKHPVLGRFGRWLEPSVRAGGCGGGAVAVSGSGRGLVERLLASGVTGGRQPIKAIDAFVRRGRQVSDARPCPQVAPQTPRASIYDSYKALSSAVFCRPDHGFESCLPGQCWPD